jgi:hypothetical protein
MQTTRILTRSLYIAVCSIFFLACEKEELVKPLPKDSPPVAMAGPDATINLSYQRKLFLDGSNSRDPDAGGRSLSYFWAKLSGPQVYYFSTQEAKATMIIIEPGAYFFELKVTDADGHVAKDTVMITAIGGPACNPYASISVFSSLLEFTLDESIPIDVSFAKGGRNLVFAGGRINQANDWGGSDVYSSRFFIHDLVSNATYKNYLSLERGKIGIAVSDDEVFFAGGILLNGNSDRVDILDLSTKSMSEAKLSAPRSLISCKVAGSKVFFAGGRKLNNEPSDVIDIFDRNTRTWSSAKLSLARAGISIVFSGTKVFFAGGDINNGDPATRVDIYDLNTGQWSIMELSTPRFDINSSVLGPYIIFSGGYYNADFGKVDQIDFLDPSSQTLFSDCLIAGSRSGMTYGPDMMTAVVDGRILYCLDRYLITRISSDGNWSMSAIPPDINWFGLTSEGNKLFGIAFDNSISDGYVSRVQIYSIYL